MSKIKDFAHEYTDRKIEAIEDKLNSLYSKAMEDCINDLERIEKDLKKLEREGATVAKKTELIHRKQRTEKIIEQMAYRIEHINETAVKILNEENLNIYSVNFNYGFYILRRETGLQVDWQMFNENLLKKLVDENENIFNAIAIDEVKDFKKIKREVERAFFSELVRGKGIDEISEAIGKIIDKNHNKLNMIVRTNITRIENAARIDSFKEGEEMGLKLKKTWVATLDNRTRPSHRELNGETVDIDEPFSNGLQYPAADGDAAEVVGCRCTLTTEFQGFTKHKLEKELDEKFKKTSWEAWSNGKIN